MRRLAERLDPRQDCLTRLGGAPADVNPGRLAMALHGFQLRVGGDGVGELHNLPGGAVAAGELNAVCRTQGETDLFGRRCAAGIDRLGRVAQHRLAAFGQTGQHGKLNGRVILHLVDQQVLDVPAWIPDAFEPQMETL